MKRLCMMLIAGAIMIGLNAVSAEAAITVDGNAGVGEWLIGNMNVYTLDPDEAAVIDQGKDIWKLWAFQDGSGNMLSRVDMYGTPNLGKASGWLNDSYVAVQMDFDGDNAVDMSVMLRKEVDFNNADGLRHFYINGVEYTNGATTYWGMGSIYEFYVLLYWSLKCLSTID